MSLKSSLLSTALLASTALAGFSTTVWDQNGANPPTAPIVKFETTIQIPDLSEQGLLLWPGMWATDMSLIQTLITNDPAYLTYYCQTSSNAWCIIAYDFGGPTGDGNDPSGTLVNPGDMVDIVYERDGGNWTQTATLNGNTLATLSWPGGDGYELGDRIECHQAVDTVPQHTYYNTIFTLSGPDPSFNSTLSVVNSTPTSFGDTSDFITWTVDQITLLSSSCACDSPTSC